MKEIHYATAKLNISLKILMVSTKSKMVMKYTSQYYFVNHGKCFYENDDDKYTI